MFVVNSVSSYCETHTMFLLLVLVYVTDEVAICDFCSGRHFRRMDEPYGARSPDVLCRWAISADTLGKASEFIGKGTRLYYIVRTCK